MKQSVVFSDGNSNSNNCIFQANSFIIETGNVKEKKQPQKTTEEPILKEPHNISFFKMRLKAYLNGHGTGKVRYLSIYFHLLKGLFGGNFI